MIEGMHILKASLGDIWADLLTTAVCNLLWVFSWILILPGPPATIAMFYYGNRLAHGEPTDVKDFLGAMRRYWKTGWQWGLVNAALIAVLVADILLTGGLGSSAWVHVFQGLYVAALCIWLIVQLFALPFLFEQEKPSLRQALRNAAVMLGRNIGFSLGLATLLACTLIAGMFLFMVSVVAGGSLLALAGNRAVINRLEAE
ncbi:MAG: DUF624 domain-containing protein [Chloroflexi bacterium]|nr:DUF624 domain-containing protein [Chloroflexota bacterium]